MSYTPIFSRIKVLPDPDVGEKRTSSGLILVEDPKRQKRTVTGVIVSVGDGCVSELSSGDRILYGEFAGFPVFEDATGKVIDPNSPKTEDVIKYQYMNEDDVVAVLKEDK